MINFPNAKINIGLNIVEKMNDGYHAIETIFYPIQLTDVLEIIPSSELDMKIWGLVIPGSNQNNLCMQAYHLLKADFPIPDIQIQLLKKIPFGAGLGGGSSDAAFLLKLLNEQFSLNLSNQDLMHYCNRLGSDCSFFIENKPLYAFGRGNVFTSLPIQLSSFKTLLIKPNIHISTSEAYANVKVKPSTEDLRDLIQLPIEKWEGRIKNGFEESLFPQFPRLPKIKERLLELGAKYASMSGSGSSMYGIFENYPKEAKEQFPDEDVFFC